MNATFVAGSKMIRHFNQQMATNPMRQMPHARKLLEQATTLVVLLLLASTPILTTRQQWNKQTTEELLPVLTCSQTPDPVNCNDYYCCATNTNATMFTTDFGVTTRTPAFDVNHVKILLVVVLSLAPTLQSCWTKPQTCVFTRRWYTGQKRSMFGQGYMITSTGAPHDNALQKVLKRFYEARARMR